MLKNHLVILFRTLSNNRLFVMVNVFGLGIAIGFCILAYFNYDFNASFDEAHINASSIYRVNSIREYQGKITAYAFVPAPLGDAIKQNVKEIELLSRFSGAGNDVRIGDEIFATNSAYVDADFFKMFTFDFIHGSASAMTDKSKIVISDQLAIKYFGNVNPMNKVITQLLDHDVTKEFEIVGVYKTQKNNSSFNKDLYTLYDNYWETSS